MIKNKLIIPIIIIIFCSLTLIGLAGYFIPIKSSPTICMTKGERFSVIMGQSDEYDSIVEKSIIEQISSGVCAENISTSYYSLYIF